MIDVQKTKVDFWKALDEGRTEECAKMLESVSIEDSYSAEECIDLAEMLLAIGNGQDSTDMYAAYIYLSEDKEEADVIETIVSSIIDTLVPNIHADPSHIVTPDLIYLDYTMAEMIEGDVIPFEDVTLNVLCNSVDSFDDDCRGDVLCAALQVIEQVFESTRSPEDFIEPLNDLKTLCDAIGEESTEEDRRLASVTSELVEIILGMVEKYCKETSKDDQDKCYLINDEFCRVGDFANMANLLCNNRSKLDDSIVSECKELADTFFKTFTSLDIPKFE